MLRTHLHTEKLQQGKTDGEGHTFASGVHDVEDSFTKFMRTAVSMTFRPSSKSSNLHSIFCNDVVAGAGVLYRKRSMTYHQN